jgi:hypothetical protein
LILVFELIANYPLLAALVALVGLGAVFGGLSENAHLSGNDPNAEQVEINVPDIHLSGVGRKEGGATAAEVATQLIEPITEAVIAEAINSGLSGKDLEGSLKDKVFDKLKGFGSSKD